MSRFSLVVSTFGRTDELHQLLDSLAVQSFSDYEIIVVDQNSDDRVPAVLSEFSNRVPCNHIRCSPGASKARNLGFAMATGEIVAFPDDDCWYTPDLLANVDRWFRKNREYSVLAVGAVDESGVPSGNRWIQSRCDLRPINIFRTTFCSTLFIKNDSKSRQALFDETIGPGSGTMFACGDETDFILQLMDLGLRGRFDRTWSIGHPRRDMLSSSVSRDRAIGYGRGMGRVLRKHSLFSLWFALMGYDFCRGVLVALRGRMSAAALCFAHCGGIFSGFSAELPPMNSRKKRLLLIDLGGSMGGVESYLLNLCGVLGASAELYCVCALPELTASLRSNGVSVHQVPRCGGAAKPLRFVFAFFLIAFLILRRGIDILQVNGFLEAIFLIPARAFGCEAVYTRHGPFEDDLYSWHNNPLQYFPRFFSRTCVHFATHVICVSETVGNVVKQIIPSDRFSVIPNWVASIPPYQDRLRRDNGGKRILYVGRLEKYKGLHLLIEALRDFPEAHLTVLGDGSYRKELEALSYGMDVDFVGFQSDTERYYADADIFVMPSMGPEGLPMVTIEAMAHGLPCLFSDLQVHREITAAGQAGMLFRSGDVDDLRAKLAELLKDTSLRHTLSLEAYGLVTQKYNPETARESYLCAFGL